MAAFDSSAGQLAVERVYFGPARSSKTTRLQGLRDGLPRMSPFDKRDPLDAASAEVGAEEMP